MQCCCCDDLYAATRIVSTDPDQGTDTNLAAAIANLPSFGGTIFVKDSLSISSSVLLPSAKDVQIVFASGSSLSVGSSAISAFTTPSGILSLRKYGFVNLKVVGDGTAGQRAWKVQDDSGRTYVYGTNCTVTGIETPLDVTAYDLTYSRATLIYLVGCHFLPISATGSDLIKAPNPAGTYAGPIVVFMTDCYCSDDDASPSHGWTFDVDADLASINTTITTAGDLSANGVFWTGGGDLFSVNATPNTFEAFSAGWQVPTLFQGTLTTGVSIKISATRGIVDGVILRDQSQIILNATNCKVKDVADSSLFGVFPAVSVDVLAGADGCSVIGGSLSVATTALIRSAAQKLRVVGVGFAAAGAAKTIQDSGAGDFTIGVGNTGVSTGGGLALAGNSKVTIGDYNFA